MAFKPVYTKAFMPVYTQTFRPVYTKAFIWGMFRHYTGYVWGMSGACLGQFRVILGKAM